MYLVTEDVLPLVSIALTAYAAVIASFLGGIHWGAAMLCDSLSLLDTKKALMWGVTPSLIAWSYFSKKVDTLAVELETLCDEFLQRQYRAAGRA